MWIIKEFRTKAARDAFLAKYARRIQYVEIFVNNRYCLEYRKLRKIG